jgi:hypothetical protein
MPKRRFSELSHVASNEKTDQKGGPCFDASRIIQNLIIREFQSVTGRPEKSGRQSGGVGPRRH